MLHSETSLSICAWLVFGRVQPPPVAQDTRSARAATAAK
jgi:hypothetical protein